MALILGAGSARRLRERSQLHAATRAIRSV